jgi:glycosyltransferase involved in cell wall biosynthesis
MNVTPILQSLLGDAVNQTVLNPCASHRWHALLDLYAAETDVQARAIVEQSLLAHVSGEGIAGFFRATFLAGATGNMQYIADAGKIVQQITPLDSDRLMAFASYEWGRTLTHGSDHAGFLGALRHACIPEIIQLAGRHLAAQTASRPVPRVIERIRKVALLTSFVGNADHTPTILILQHARLLQSQGMEVRIFACQEVHIQQCSHYLGNRGEVLTPAPDLNALAARMPPDLTVMLSDTRFSLMHRWQEMLAIIDAFDPDLVLFVGLNSPLVLPLYQARPVLGLCLHAVSPMAPVDLWLTARSELAGQFSTDWGSALPPALGYYHPYRIALQQPLITQSFGRADLGLKLQHAVLITVGARLIHEITGDWANRMANLLQRRPQLIWVLLGGNGSIPAALSSVPSAQIRALPHQDNVRGILQCCDIYVNPLRVGGGFSVAEAMAEGLPVVAFANGDGGNKLGDRASANIDDYFGTLESLLDECNVREQTGAAMRALFSATLDLEQSTLSLRHACERTLETYRRRVGAIPGGRWPATS